MQEAICGVKPKTNLNPDQETGDDQLPDLGLFVLFYFYQSFLCFFS
jgi:hypothetical protein